MNLIQAGQHILELEEVLAKAIPALEAYAQYWKSNKRDAKSRGSPRGVATFGKMATEANANFKKAKQLLEIK